MIRACVGPQGVDAEMAEKILQKNLVTYVGLPRGLQPNATEVSL